MVLNWVLLILVLVFTSLAIGLQDLLFAALSLAVSSLFLSIVFFLRNAPIAGVFELSICAGLIPVLLIAGGTAFREIKEKPRVSSYLLYIGMGIGFLIIAFLVIGSIGEVFGGAYKLSFISFEKIGSLGTMLWESRGSDLLGQLAVLWAGTLGVLVFLRKTKEEKKNDS